MSTGPEPGRNCAALDSATKYKKAPRLHHGWKGVLAALAREVDKTKSSKSTRIVIEKASGIVTSHQGGLEGVFGQLGRFNP